MILPVATFFIVEAINCCHKFIEPFHFSDLKMNFESAFGIVFTALLWGITDPLLKKFGTGFNERSPDSGNYGFVRNLIREILFLLTNWKYVITLISNQIGSVTFLWTLARCQVSV